MRFTIILAHFVYANPNAAREEWSPDPIPGTVTKPGIWDTEVLDDPGKMVWDGYIQMNRSNPPVLNAANFKLALNKFLLFLQPKNRDNYQQVHLITETPTP